MAPWLLFGFFVAGVISIFLSASMVRRHLGRSGFLSVCKSSLFGVPIPLCSCGVLPVAASLRKNGASKGATGAFLLSTPQTGVDSILVTWAMLGPVFAIVRPLIAFLTGVLGGAFIDRFGMKEHDDDHEKSVTQTPSDPSSWGTRILQGVKHGFVTLPGDMGKDLLVGILLAGLIAALVPDGFFARQLGQGWLPMLVMMVAGIPLYVCATASVPIAAALLMKGVSPGAVFVFLVTGPATNMATLALIRGMLGNRSAIFYLLSVAVSALGGGWLLNLIFSGSRSVQVSDMSMLPVWLKAGSAVVLLLLIFAGFYRDRKEKKKKKDVCCCGPDHCPMTNAL